MGAFSLKTVCGSARAGVLKTGHGEIRTPFFMPVATKGSVKLLSNEEVKSTKTQCIISNAFILSLKPGLDVIGLHGGLHGFMKWDGGLFTDSGGFQVLNSKFCRKISDEGVVFKNPFDGKKNLFSPEKSVEIQNRLGSDAAMCLDDVPMAGATPARLKESVERTTLWAKRCLDAHENKKQLLFGICQGGVNLKLREKSAKEISGIGFDGHAIGGLAIGEEMGKMFGATRAALNFLAPEKPRYLMGVGSVPELVKAVSLGVDLFDSAFPTRTARHGLGFSAEKNLKIESGKFAKDLAPIDKSCSCFVCQKHSRAYIHHLVRTNEQNGQKYLSYHNLFFVQSIMELIRTQITEGTFVGKKFLKAKIER